MKNKLFASLWVALLLVGCTAKKEKVWTGVVFGVPYEVRVPAEEKSNLRETEKAVRAAWHAAEAILDGRDSDSEIQRFNRSEKLTWLPASRALVDAVEMALRSAKLTDGAWDPTAGKLEELYRGAKPPAPALIAQARQKVGYYLVEVRHDPLALKKSRRGIVVDLASLAPGFAVDMVVEALQTLGLTNFRVQAGTAVRAMGAGPWSLRYPTSSGETVIQETVQLENRAAATVSLPEAGKPLVPVPTVDPRTGAPLASDLASVTVFDPSALRAQALATAFFAVGKKVGTELALKQTTGSYFMSLPSQAQLGVRGSAQGSAPTLEQ